jgi:hypothetical protein
MRPSSFVSLSVQTLSTAPLGACACALGGAARKVQLGKTTVEVPHAGQS